MNYNKLKGAVVSKGFTMEKMCNDLSIFQSTLIRQCKNNKLPMITVKKIIDYLSLTRDEYISVFFED